MTTSHCIPSGLPVLVSRHDKLQHTRGSASLSRGDKRENKRNPSGEAPMSPWSRCIPSLTGPSCVVSCITAHMRTLEGTHNAGYAPAEWLVRTAPVLSKP